MAGFRGLHGEFQLHFRPRHFSLLPYFISSEMYN